MNTQLQTFNFKSNIVRAELIENEPYFCLSDVCSVMDIKNSRRVNAEMLDQKGVRNAYTLTNGGKQELTFINEPNLYRIIFKSRKAEAVEFQNWVFDEVLPQIRKTGKYEKVSTTVDDRTGLRDAVNMLVSKKGLIYSDAYNLVHQYMNVKSIEDIAKDDLPKAVAYCHKLVLEGELIIEQPKAENFSLTANDVVELAWCLFSAKQQNDLLQMLVKPLDEIKSGYSSEVYTFASEYRHCWQLSFPILDKLVALIDKSTSDTNYKRIVMHFKKIRDDLNKPALMFKAR
ncbi:BRO family protein [Gallibacterium anatis]|uniref:BRO family protein n=1 Tax=Gallibacterium anatis TaxID=750 RepID=A0AAX3XD23_9PAST|nr:BRO family protein [Gallibacterium anatis]MDK9430928.1 BRO family protein [Gallibacterium anatis]WIM80098.1 BRO family protein [Gallibacterium anatis]